MNVPSWSSARRLGLVAVLAVLVTSPAIGSTQVAAPTAAEASSRTHTVRPGDTLWDLARQYLGDPFQWPQIFRLNPEVIEDPHWIYPGEVLQLPGSASADVAAAPAAAPATAPAAAPAAEPEQPGAVAAAPAVGQQVQIGAESPTIFASAAVRQSSAPRGNNVAVVRGPVVRRGEYESAPFLSRGAPTGTGRLLQAVDVNSMLSRATLGVRRFQLRERVAIQPPAGRSAAVGDLYVAVRMGGKLDGRDIVVPTAIVRVDETIAGRAPVVSLIREFESVTPEHRLVPYAAWIADSLRAVPVSNGRTTRVLGVFGDELAPSLQNFVFFPLGTRDGVKPGDQLQIYREARRDGDATIPEIELAVVTLVRVTDHGATAVVITQSSSRFEAGTAARIIARMP